MYFLQTRVHVLFIVLVTSLAAYNYRIKNRDRLSAYFLCFIMPVTLLGCPHPLIVHAVVTRTANILQSVVCEYCLLVVVQNVVKAEPTPRLMGQGSWI